MIIIPMLLTRELRPKEGVRAWRCSLCRCPVFPSLGPPGPCLSSSLLSPPRSCLSLPVSLPPLSPSFPQFLLPSSPEEASLASLFRARILLKPQRGDGFYRPRTRTGRMLTSPHSSLPCCSWHPAWERVGGRAPIPLMVRGRGYWGWLCSLAGRTIQGVEPNKSRGPQIWCCHLLLVTISGSRGVAHGSISGKVCAKM